MDVLKELTELKNNINNIDTTDVVSVKIVSDSITDDNEFPIVKIVTRYGIPIERQEEIRTNFQDMKSEFTYIISEHPNEDTSEYTLWKNEILY